MARNKKFNRKAEFAYQNEEMYAMLDAQTAGGAYPEKELHEGWEVILRNQFHDILPGSSIKEVYDDSKAEYEGIFAENKALTDATLAHIAAGVKAPKHSLVVYNPNSAAAYDLVTFTVPEGMEEACSLRRRDKTGCSENRRRCICILCSRRTGKRI